MTIKKIYLCSAFKVFLLGTIACSVLYWICDGMDRLAGNRGGGAMVYWAADSVLY